MQKLREELDQPYGFSGRSEPAAGVSCSAWTATSERPQGVNRTALAVGERRSGPSRHLRGLMYEMLDRDEIEFRIGKRRLISRETLDRFVETNSRAGGDDNRGLSEVGP